KPKEEDLLKRIDRLEKEIQELKGALKNMERAKGKRILQSEEEEGVIDEVCKKLQSLDGRLGNAKSCNDYILSTLKSIYNFIEQHVHSIC
ncbi:hypothetical protein KI387_029671, partial [Taxus chinensis]